MSAFPQELISAIECADLYDIEDWLEQDESYPATIDRQDADGRTLLHHAAAAGNNLLITMR